MSVSVMERGAAREGTMAARKKNPHKPFRPIGYDKAILERLKYDPETGKVYNERGRELGSKNKYSGRVVVRVGAFQFYRAHIAWLISSGSWPEHTIDHINRDPGDDRLCNLRCVTQSENNFNRRHCNGV